MSANPLTDLCVIEIQGLEPPQEEYTRRSSPQDLTDDRGLPVTPSAVVVVNEIRSSGQSLIERVRRLSSI